jgi:hypothetical protein
MKPYKTNEGPCPSETVAALAALKCFELLRPMPIGEGRRCLELFSIAPVRPEDTAVYSHIHVAEQPPEWRERTLTA